MGDTKNFCPVILKENFILYPGNTETAAKYREKYYYFSTSENRDKFLENPDEYVSHNEPLKVCNSYIQELYKLTLIEVPIFFKYVPPCGHLCLSVLNM